jgi:hypothetical protein
MATGILERQASDNLAVRGFVRRAVRHAGSAAANSTSSGQSVLKSPRSDT